MVASRWRSRVGSTWGNSGGVVHLSSQIINHPQYNPNTENNDFSILRLSTNIQFNGNTVASATIAGPNYYLGDNQIVWAIGWGRTSVMAFYLSTFRNFILSSRFLIQIIYFLG